jgi:hypothetical protein
MVADSEPAASRRVVALRPGQVAAGLVLAPPATRRPGDELAGRLVQALGSAAAANVDLAAAFGYAFPAELVDGWLDVLVQALGSAAAAYLDRAVECGYAFPAELVDGWLDVLVDAGVDLVDVLGWAAEYVDLPAQVGP